MRLLTMRWHHVLGLTFVLLMTAGCFQAVDAGLSATSAAQVIPTFTPIPSNTPEPTITPMPTETERPRRTRQPQAEQTEDTTDPLLLLTPGTEVALQGTIDPVFLTVTAIYAQDQPTQEPAVQVPAQQELDPIAMTATHIVDMATQAAAFQQTQAAIAAGTIMPTVAPPTQQQQPQQPQQPNVTLVPGQDCIHEVRATDRNLYRIALNYGITVDQIAQASGIVNPDLIFVGQRLTIPGCGVTGARPLATSTPVAGSNGNQGDTSQNPPTGATAVPAMTFTPIPDGSSQGGNQGTGGSCGTHIVRQGETLFEISLQCGGTVESIAAANGIANINLIYIGQEIVIP